MQAYTETAVCCSLALRNQFLQFYTMKQAFGTILILICFLIGFSKSKTLKNITEAQVIDVKQISEEAGHGHCGNDWLVTPNYLGIVESTYI